MKQSRSASFWEAVISTVAGFTISLVAQWLFFAWWLGLPLSLTQNVTFAIIMTFVSIGRGYVLRRIFEALHIRRPLSPAMLAIIAERLRQIDAEGWTPEHDDKHTQGELALAGAAYAMHAGHLGAGCPEPMLPVPPIWPWRRDHWKPMGFRRTLVKAGALLLAEIERDDRNKRKPDPVPMPAPTNPNYPEPTRVRVELEQAAQAPDPVSRSIVRSGVDG